MSDLREIPGIGENMEKHLIDLGINRIDDLKGKNPEELFMQDTVRCGGSLDRCVLYVYRLAVYYADNPARDPEKTRWWYWKDKPYLGGMIE